MSCHSCGTLLPSNARFCPNCGEVSEQTSPQVTTRDYLSSRQGSPTDPLAQRSSRRFSRALVILIPVLILVLVGAGLLIYNANASSVHLQHTARTAQAPGAVPTEVVGNPYTHTGKLAFTDPLAANNGSQQWDVNRNCAFKGGAYHVIAPDPRFSDYCTANATNFSNFAFEVSMKIIQGDAGGILLRVENTNPNQFYDFYVGQNGTYGFEVVNGSKFSVLKGGTSPAIRQGLNAVNVLGVVAQGSSMTLYVNQQRIASVTDPGYHSGQIGVYAVVYSHATEVAFSNARLWTL
ncbi:MAG TPA: zinc-ribbon domain-containing protein [Ktedonobacteraceae bacterium]|nr:zinc-ribbon domain-containing protein [Ktedonobacteraceae bacterium]